MSSVNKMLTYFHTVRHLKPIQIGYQLKYRVLSAGRLKIRKYTPSTLKVLSLPKPCFLSGSLTKNNGNITATYLNLSEAFTDSVDWNYQRYGKLWNYHLQYAGYLHQQDLTPLQKTELILDLYQHLADGRVKPEPYPASLRIMNVIRFLQLANLSVEHEKSLLTYLYSELWYVRSHLEYHILGNHLLENAFALLMGGTYFRDAKLVSKGAGILNEQLKEQILNDGAHFERSPLYHNTILYRVLEALSYLDDSVAIKSQLDRAARKMLGWAFNMQFSDGSTPHFNDSLNGLALSSEELASMAGTLGINADYLEPLSDSGYRKIAKGPFELFMDLDGVEPSYQPGHAHADSLSIQLYIQGRPFLTDPGISTYESGPRRDWERSTEAHNTVSAGGRNSAEVWGGFRVGKRPEVRVTTDLSNILSATLRFGSDRLIRRVEVDGKRVQIDDQHTTGEMN